MSRFLPAQERRRGGALQVCQSAGCAGLGDFFKEEVEATGSCVGFDLSVPEVFLQVVEPPGHFRPKSAGGRFWMASLISAKLVMAAHLLVYCTPIGSGFRLGILPLGGLLREWAAPRPEFEGFGEGELSGGMDSPDFSGAGSAEAGMTAKGGLRGGGVAM